MRQVPDIAAVEIDRLRTEGYTVSDDDVVWLSCLGRLVEQPANATLEASGIIDGIRLSDETVLKPLTLIAERWLKKYGPVFGKKAELLVVAYASAYPERLDMSASAKAVVRTVAEFGDNLRVSPGEIEAAVVRLLDRDTPENPDHENKIDMDSLLGFMEASTGLTREYWEQQDWMKIDSTHRGIMKYVAMMAGSDYDPDAQASRIALKNLILAVNEIRGRQNGA